MCAATPLAAWRVQVVLVELLRLMLESEPPVEEHDQYRPLPRAIRPVLMTEGTDDGCRVEPVGEHRQRAGQRWHCPRTVATASMFSMSTDPGSRDGAVPLEPVADSDSNADASPPAFPDQTYEQIHVRAMARPAVIVDEWQQARDDFLRG